MKIFFVCVNGYPGSGKTTFEEYCRDYLGKNCAICSSIRPIKQLASFFGWDGGKDEWDRLMLSQLKQIIHDWCRADGRRDYTREETLRQVYAHADMIDDLYLYPFETEETVIVAFIDVREPEELEWYKNAVRATTVLMERKPNEVCDYGNSSDNEVYGYIYDLVLENTGDLAALEEKAKNFCDTIVKTNKYVNR